MIINRKKKSIQIQFYTQKPVVKAPDTMISSKSFTIYILARKHFFLV